MADADAPGEGPRIVELFKDMTVTRRLFLGGSGSSALLLGEFVAAQDIKPTFARVGSHIQLRAGPAVWTIDPAWFRSDDDPFTSVTPSSLTITAMTAGVNLRAAWRLVIEQVGGRWGIRWKYGDKPLGWVGFLDWLQGTSLKAAVAAETPDKAPAGSLRVANGSYTGQLVFPFSLTALRRNSPIDYVLGSEKGTAVSLDVVVFTTDATDQNHSSQAAITPEVDELVAAASKVLKTRVTLSAPAIKGDPGGWPLGEIHETTLRLYPTPIAKDAPNTARIDVETLLKGNDTILVHRRSTSSESRIVVGKPEPFRSLVIDQAELIEVIGGSHGLLLKPSDRPRWMQGLRYAASIRGADAPATLQKNFRGQDKRLELPVILHILHASGRDRARYAVDFRSYYRTGGRFLDRGAIVWSDDRVDGVEAVLSIGKPSSAQPGPHENRLHFGTRSGASVALHRPSHDSIDEASPVLRARRHQDAFDLGFIFHDWRLEIGKQDWRAKSTKDDATLVPGSSAQRAVRFQPQHLFEEVFSPADGQVAQARGVLGSIFDACVSFLQAPAPRVEFRKLGTTADYAQDAATTRLARTRASGTSRIVFETPGVAAADMPLSVENLTNWRELSLRVPRRAVGDMALDDQLTKLLGITSATTREQARAIVRGSLQPPGGDETALELTTGLVFSPDATARFRTPRRAPGNDTGLWTAQLELQPIAVAGQPPPPESRVRAIWATGLEPKAIIGAACAAPRDDSPFQSSLDLSDRIEIVILTAGFGLAALRGVTLQGQDVPQSLVRLPKGTYNFLDLETGSIGDAPDAPRIRQEGVMSPKPFDRFRARLTSFGADLDLEWQGEPAAPFRGTRKDPFFGRALSVERYVHRTSLGSDIYVQVVYKGFLFPYGFRVSLIKVTQREPWAVDGMGAMMPAIQRYFILPKPVEKTFPGIYQPFDGMEIPVRHARLVGGISPELDFGEMKPPPELSLPAPAKPKNPACGDVGDELVGRVFWPRRRMPVGADANASHIRFEFEADETGTRRSVPMLFLDNAAVHTPATVRAVIDYYNHLADTSAGGDQLWLRRELHHGGKTIFAAPNKTGDTSFETDHILLKARNRVTPTSDDVPSAGPPSDPDLAFTMDAFMEGADEPPFYPVMAEASIAIPALDRIMGSPQGLKRVGYSSHYLRSGFRPGLNDAELFLNFLDGGGEMSFAAQGEIAGGLSQTPTPLAGISRANAIVGARPSQAPAAPVTAVAGSDAGAPSVGTDALAPWDMESVKSGTFDPAQFFGDAKLLGVIPLGQAIQATAIAAQPKLKESFEYALGEASAAAIPQLQLACRAAADAVASALKEAERALAALNLPTPPTPAPPPYSGIRSYYPKLTVSLMALEKSLRDIANDAGLTLAGIPAAVAQVTNQWRELRSEVDAVIANPAPEPIRKVMGDLRKAADLVEGGLGKVLGTLLGKAVDAAIDTAVLPLIDRAIDACYAADGTFAHAAAIEAFLGTLPATLPAKPSKAQLHAWAKALLAQEAPTLTAEMAAAPLSRALTGPLLAMIRDVRRFRTMVSDAEKDAIATVAEAVFQALRRLLTTMSNLAALVDAAAAGATRMCVATAGAAKPLAKVAALVLDMLPDPADLVRALDVVENRLKTLTVPNLGDAPEAIEVRRCSGELRVSVQTLAAQIAAAEAMRGAFQDLGELCGSPGRIPVMIAELAPRRSATLAAFQDCVSRAEATGAAVAKLPDAAVRTTTQALRELCAELTLLARAFTLARLVQVADEAQTNLARRLNDALSGLDPTVTDRALAPLAAIAAAARRVEDKLAEIRTRPDPYLRFTPEDLAQIAGASAALAALEEELFTAATDFTVLTGGLLDDARTMLSAIAGGALAPLIEVHRVALAQADAAIAALDSSGDVVLALAGKLRDLLRTARAAVSKDLNALVAVSSNPSAAGALLSRWTTEGSGLVNAATTIIQLFNAVAQGQIGAIFDLSTARRAIEDAIRRLIPSRVNLDYQWTAKLEPFPRGDPIFRPRLDEFDKPVGDANLPDLSIVTAIRVDLLKPDDRELTVKGTLQPFSIHLMGKPIDLARIAFTGTEFELVDGKPRFKTQIAGVAIGSALKFLSALQSLMTTGGNGFYVTPKLDPPGIKVGYAFSSPLIPLGPIVVTNVTIDISALLRFDGGQAEFGFAFASRERPFGMIVAPCYFGGGFVGLTANADGVQSMEIQLEFGAATAISFGPLDAQGRITSGIYLFYRRDNSQHLEGFVHAVGEGQIACFGISVNIEVKITQTAAGDMNGSASYRFSFRVGIVSVSYEFTATYNIAKGDRSTTARTSGAHLARFASPVPGLLCAPDPSIPHRINVPDKLRDWTAYRRYYVGAWAEA